MLEGMLVGDISEYDVMLPTETRMIGSKYQVA